MTSRTGRYWLFGIAVVAAVATTIGTWYFLKTNSGYNRPYASLPLSFDGTSDRLQQTVIVPTLESPIPEGKSAIWCASFQLAWNRLKDDVAKEPLRVDHAQVVADALNNGAQSEDDINPEAVYARAGLVKDGVVERIQSDMVSRFPNVPRPAFGSAPEGAVAYAYLAASAKFDLPFFDNDEPFVFTDAAGRQTSISSFGIRKKDDYAYEQLRKQVQILYYPKYEEAQIPEFVLDACKSSQPYQIVLARLERKQTLAETLADVEHKISADPKTGSLRTDKLLPRDSVLVPNMAWRVAHHFRELEGKDKQFQNPSLRGLYLDAALQTIEFRLDRSGAELASESKVEVKPYDSYFLLNRPFLIFMKKRGGKQPFFVMWVDNGELLQKW
jgi:hypothetical protein